jgi:DNA-binding PadR family transcriptional regulator
MVKANLETILVTLVALQGQGTHGKALMGDLAELFGAQLSPGTVYPSLHQLDDDDVFEVYEMVRTKEYRVADDDAAYDLVAEAMYQHLAIGFFFQQALRRME